MFGRVLNLPLHIFFWVNINELPNSSSSAKIRMVDLGELFHNVVMKKFALLVVLLNSDLHYNFFCSSNSFCCYCKTVSLQDKITSKLILLIFLFDLFDYLLNFFTMFDMYRLLMNYTFRFFLLIFFTVYFITA